MKSKPAPGIVSQVNLFPVPVLTYTWPEATLWRGELLEAVLRVRQSHAGVKMSTRGGWQSAKTLPAWPDRSTAALLRWSAAMASRTAALWRHDEALNLIREWRMDAWANINTPGNALNAPHTHTSIFEWNWSACYYVDVPSDMTGGEIVFEDRMNGLDVGSAADGRRRSYAASPVEGELIVFPSWLYHSVRPHAGTSDRVSIAMNFHSPWLERSRYWPYRVSWYWRNMPAVMRVWARLRGRRDLSDPKGPPGYDVTAEPTYL